MVRIKASNIFERYKIIIPFVTSSLYKRVAASHFYCIVICFKDVVIGNSNVKRYEVKKW